MGPLLSVVCLCFRKIVIVTCKILSFLCNLDNFLFKNIMVFIFGNQMSKWCFFEKRVILTFFSHFFSHQGKDAKVL